MKSFTIGLIAGCILASAVWWISLKPDAGALPDGPFNRLGVYRIRERCDYLIVERKPKGLEVGVRRSYASPAAEGWGGVTQPADWIKTADWFAFVDSDLHIWLYDGASDLKVLELRDDDTVFFEPSRFSPPVELLNRLPKAVVEAEWPKTNSSEQAVAPNRSFPPSQESTSPVRSPED